jgi:hypothetical protein
MKRFLSPVVIIVVIMILATLGTLFVMARNDQKRLAGLMLEQSATTTPVLTASSTPPRTIKVSAATRDWKLYRNPALGIEFKYPKTWSYVVGTGDSFSIRFSNYSNTYLQKKESPGSVLPVDLNIVLFYEQKDPYYKTPELLKARFATTTAVVTEELRGVGFRALKIVSPAGKGLAVDKHHDVTTYDVWRDDGTVYEFSNTYNLDNASQKQQLTEADTIEKMISTFKLVKPIPISQSSNYLIGIWQQGPVLGSGWDNRYQFFPSGTYNYRLSQGDCANRDKGHSGTWRVENNVLILSIQQKIVKTGGTVMGGSPVCSGGLEIQGATLATVKLQTPQIQRISLQQCAQTAVEHYPCITISRADYYRFSDDPTYGNSSDLDQEPTF